MFKTLTNSLLSKITQLAQPSTKINIPISHHAFPAWLPQRTCKGLFQVGDFPGATTEFVTVTDSGDSSCAFNDPSCQDNCEQATVSLATYSDAKLAHAWYTFEANFYAASTPLESTGDEAATGCNFPNGSQCLSNTAVMRVANYVLTIVATGGSLGVLLQKGVHELCADCKFPTSPGP